MKSIESKELKRQTALIAGKYLEAFELNEYFRHRKVNAVIVQKFAVQVHPLDVAKAEEAMYEYTPDWRKEAKKSGK